MSNNQKIFVQVASYRDPQLIPTIEDMLKNSKYPKNLTIGICNQYHPDDDFSNLKKYNDDERFKIINIVYSNSKGTCWARNQIQQLYSDEEYTLQIDSHMRFEKNWDEILIKMLRQLQDKGHEKPLLTTYVPSFNPDNDPNGRIMKPWRMNFDKFIPEGAVFFLPETIPNWEGLEEPIPSRFYSAHFCFTLGVFSKEVQHNPNYYFHGEEISIGVRAFTHGYDLFHPHRVVVWHEYTRKGRTKQWDDDKSWSQKNNKSHLTNRKLFGMDGETQEGHDGPFGFGNVRTLRQYEEYSGLHFASRGVQKYTLEKNQPPNPIYNSEEDFLNSFTHIFKHCINLSFNEVPEKDYEFWVVAYHNKNDETIFRKDVNVDEINKMVEGSDGSYKIWREFNNETKPKYWVVWPYSKSKGWCKKIVGEL
jgi:hypothetical protein